MMRLNRLRLTNFPISPRLVAQKQKNPADHGHFPLMVAWLVRCRIDRIRFCTMTKFGTPNRRSKLRNFRNNTDLSQSSWLRQQNDQISYPPCWYYYKQVEGYFFNYFSFFFQGMPSIHIWTWTCRIGHPTLQQTTPRLQYKFEIFIFIPLAF